MCIRDRYPNDCSKIDESPTKIIRGKRTLSQIDFKELVQNVDRENLLKNLSLEQEKLADLNKLLEIETENVSTWENVVKEEHLQIYKIKHENNPAVLVKAFTKIPAEAEKVYEVIYNEAVRKKWENVLAEFTCIHRFDEDSDVIYSSFKAPFGVSDRDFCQKRTTRKNFPGQGEFVIHFKSINFPTCPPVKKKIRAETHISGYVIRPLKTNPKHSSLTIVAQTDPKGAIPKAIVNYAAGKAPADWVKSLTKACQKTF
eukprot:TRINITY_DN5983_c0_g1_i1.p1 TRINITY_DN5983_c0_g1~~TRINITY_DN5983_c0_g1_i1.p1  ORF type:complete len:287 (-),score=62.32 TRINITY_DN5983_c0_g1_i1:181-951(-)